MSAITKRKMKRKIQQRKATQLLPAIVAVGGACGLAALPAAALELGEIEVNSSIGQPLRASIAYALNPTEKLSNHCIYLRPGATANGIPVFSQAQIAITDGAILLTGNTPVREPMLSMQVAIDCRYTPHLLREYTIMIDPANPAIADGSARGAASATETAAVELTSEPRVAREVIASTTSSASVRPARPTTALDTSISLGTEYRVQSGDTVSTIVTRIEGRTTKLWPAVNAIFEANPHAFIKNDVNRLMAGTVLTIPALVGNNAPTTDATTSADVEPSTATDSAPWTIISEDPITATDLAAPTEAGEEALSAAGPAPQNQTVEDATSAIKTTAWTIISDTVVDGTTTNTADTTPRTATDSPVVNTIIEDDTATRVTPVVGTPLADTSTNRTWSWLVWLGGAGLALLLGLLLFGRSIRERFGSLAMVSAEIEGRRSDDDPTQKARVIEDVDYEFEDTINSQAISLDADLEDGTGLQETLDIDVAQDYGFTTSGQAASKIDIEVTEYAALDPEDTSTDVIPPQHRSDVASILDQEVPVENDGGEYDFSMIVDATKQAIGDYDDTAKDLQAIRIDADTDDDSEDDGAYTMSNEVDYQVLEQDYEDELTATQALNAEVVRAAEELALQMRQGDDVAITAQMHEIEATIEMPNAEKTQEMPVPAKSEAIIVPEVSNPDHTAELKANLPTSLDAENDPDALDLASATTIELSAAGSDVTVEMVVESGKVDTKKKN